MDTQIRAQKVDPGEENSPATPAGTQTCDLSSYMTQVPFHDKGPQLSYWPPQNLPTHHRGNGWLEDLFIPMAAEGQE